MQSELGDIIAKVRAALRQGQRVLFSGVPCQVAGLYAVLGHDWEGLYTLDVLCNNTPSPLWFERYLKEQYGSGQVREFNFRSRNPCLPMINNVQITLRDGRELLFQPGNSEPFRRLFAEHVLMTDFCEHCRFADCPRQGDLTLGDFGVLSAMTDNLKAEGARRQR